MTLKHSPNFAADPGTSPAFLLDMAYHFQEISEDAWRHQARFPSAGIHLLFVQLGNPDTFGLAVSVYPELTFRFPYQGKLQGYFSIGSGLAWLTRKFDEQGNPGNTAIGSHLNASAILRLGLEYRFGNAAFFTHAGLTHFSNISVLQPNLGLNILHAGAGYLYRFNDTDFPELKHIPTPAERWSGSIKVRSAIWDMHGERFDNEHDIWSAISYSMHAGYATSLINRMTVGIQHTMNFGQRAYNGNNAFHNLSLVIGDEVKLGRFGLFAALGIYLYVDYRTTSPVFTEFGTNIYLMDRPGRQFFAGLNMKTHFGAAEYPELSIGWVF